MVSDEEYIKQQKEHYNKIAERYMDDIPSHVFDYYVKIKCGYIIKNLKSAKNATALDVGCGLGEHAKEIAKYVKNIIAIDISSSMISMAEKIRHEDNLDYIISNAINLPFKSQTFDLVFSIGLLHHLVTEKNCMQYLRESTRVVKNNGYVVVSDINANNPLWNIILKRAKFTDTGDETIWKMPEIKKFFADAGLDIINIFYFGAVANFIPKQLVPIFDTMGKLIQKTPLHIFGAHYYVISRKI